MNDPVWGHPKMTSNFKTGIYFPKSESPCVRKLLSKEEKWIMGGLASKLKIGCHLWMAPVNCARFVVN